MNHTYQIVSHCEKRGIRKLESFSKLKDAIQSLDTYRSVCARHGYIEKNAVKSFVWEWLDEPTGETYRTLYQITKIA